MRDRPTPAGNPPPPDDRAADPGPADEAEAVLRRLPLARPSASLDRQVMDMLAAAEQDSAALSGGTTGCGPSDRSLGAGTSPPVGTFARRLRPALLASAALLALAVGLSPLVPTRGQVAGVGGEAARPFRPVGMPALAPPQDASPAADEVVSAPADPTESDDPSPADDPPDAAGLLINVEQTFERVERDGVVLVDGPTAYQRDRRYAVNRFVVLDPTTGGRVTVTLPVQETVVRRVEPF